MHTKDGYICADYISTTDPASGWECLGDWRITAYAETGLACANGEYPEVGYTIACNSLEFGTKVYIEGIGFRTVEDRGPTWMGDAWLDVYMGDVNTCIQFGDQVRRVWIVRQEGKS
jgi:3D (Asp-Asp-Asp) domain-containing protein